MKKMILVAVSALFMVAGCEENKTENSAGQAKPVAEQPVAQKAAPAASDAQIEVKSIDWDKAIEMAAAGAVYVDVRNPEELNDGYAPNALNIPLPVLRERVGELSKDKDLLVYCRSGRRSEIATKYLMSQGYERVYNVLGGYLAYPKK